MVLFGIGTDYNILLYEQFKEELSKGEDRHTAAAKQHGLLGEPSYIVVLQYLLDSAPYICEVLNL